MDDPTTKPPQDTQRQPGSRKPQNIKERLYEHIKIPLRVLDAIIVLLFLAIAFLLIWGTITGTR